MTMTVVRPWRVVLRSVLLAAVLAAAASPIVALSFLLPPARVIDNVAYSADPVDWHSMEPISAAVLAVVVLQACAGVGGFVGGLTWLWRHGLGACLALASAWATGIIALPSVAHAIGATLRTGIVCGIRPCEALLRDDAPNGGPYAFLTFLVGDLLLLGVGVLAAAVGMAVAFGVASWVQRRSQRRPTLPSVVWLLGFALTYGVGVLFDWDVSGGLIPYVTLTVGVVLWAIWMDRADRASAISA